MTNIEVGDIVRMKPKFYGSDYRDQWKGITGIVLDVINDPNRVSAGLTLLVQHPEDLQPIPIFAFIKDVEKLYIKP